MFGCVFVNLTTFQQETISSNTFIQCYICFFPSQILWNKLFQIILWHILVKNSLFWFMYQIVLDLWWATFFESLFTRFFSHSVSNNFSLSNFLTFLILPKFVMSDLLFLCPKCRLYIVDLFLKNSKPLALLNYQNFFVSLHNLCVALDCNREFYIFKL